MSEVIYLGSEPRSEATPSTSEDWSEWLPKGELAGFLKVSEKTIETRVKDGEYQAEKRKGRAYIRIPKASEDFGKLPGTSSDETPNASDSSPNTPEGVPNNLGSQSETIPNQTPKVSEPASESKSLALLIEQLNQAHQETIKSMQAQIDELKEDKARMTRQIEAGNTAIVTMRDAKKMVQQSIQLPGWLTFWNK